MAAAENGMGLDHPKLCDNKSCRHTERNSSRVIRQFYHGRRKNSSGYS